MRRLSDQLREDLLDLISVRDIGAKMAVPFVHQIAVAAAKACNKMTILRVVERQLSSDPVAAASDQDAAPCFQFALCLARTAST